MLVLLRSKTFIVGVVIVGFWVFCAFFGATVAPHDPLAQSLDILQAPGSKHLFGTDTLGRDVFSRVLAGARDVLLVAPLATLVGITGGTAVGLTSGYLGGLVDDVISRVVDAVLSIPVVIIAVTVLVALGSSTLTLVIVIGIVFTPIVSRTVRAATLVERQMDYVQAARLDGNARRTSCSGKSSRTSWVRHCRGDRPARICHLHRRGPHVPGLRRAAALSGLGAPDLAALHATQRHGAFWLLLDRRVPGRAIASLVVGVNLIADGLQHALDE